MAKDYYGKCGSCKYCDLGTANTSWTGTSFKCTISFYAVEASEKSCSRWEPAPGRTNDVIEKYDR